MKRISVISGLILVLMTSLVVPAIAQEEKETRKSEQIIITRKGDKSEKVVIEFKDDKVIVNGKEIDEFEDENIIVKRGGFVGTHVFAPGRSFGLTNQGGNMFFLDENRAMLGVTTEKVDNGAEVKEVAEESAAAKAGIKKGDIITKIGDEEIEDPDELSKAIHESEPGDKVTVEFLRDGKKQTVTAELGEWKGLNLRSFNYTPDFHFEMPKVDVTGVPGMESYFWSTGQTRLGLTVQDTEDGEGVQVLAVDVEGNAAKAGIKKDDIITHVNDKEVNSADQISRMVRENRDERSFMVKIKRDGKTQNIELKMPRKLRKAQL